MCFLVIRTKRKSRHLIRKAWKEGYYDGIERGYALGMIARQADEQNKGCVLGIPEPFKNAFKEDK